MGVGILEKDTVVQTYERFAHPLAVCTNQINEGMISATDSWLLLVGSARIQSVKSAADEKGIILRILNLEQTEQPVILSLFRDIVRAEMTDIYENPVGDIHFEGNYCTLVTSPGALKTIRICL